MNRCRLYLILSLGIILLGTQNMKAQIANAGFENWTNDTLLYEFPPYKGSTAPFTSFANGMPNVYPVAGCNSATAIRLETVAADEDTLSGVFIGSQNPLVTISGGMPYTGTPDSFSVCLRYDIQPMDTASVSLIFSSNGLPIAFSTLRISGNQSSFKDTTVDIPDFGIFPPDTVLFLISSSNLDGDSIPVGSWLEVDNLTMIGDTLQLINGDFEQKVPIELESPDDWFSIDQLTAAFGFSRTVTKSSDAFVGDYSLRLETVEVGFFDEPDTFGFVTNGQFEDEGPEGGQPYAGSMPPSNIGGFYKYIPVGTDTAIAYAMFTKYDPVLSKRDTLAFTAIKLAPVDSFDYFEITVDTFTFTQTPDSFLVVFASSTFADSGFAVAQGVVGIGSALFLDELGFNQVDRLEAEFQQKFEFQIYPNPTTTSCSVSFISQQHDPYTLRLINRLGQIVERKELGAIPAGQEFNMKWNTNLLPSGIYIFMLEDEKGQLILSKKLLIQ